MIPYKDIGDNLTTNEFNGVISLLRDNINFTEDINITNSTVTGTYGNYIFDFNEATILDNGILITNETLSTVGTVKLTNAVFPHSHYFLDLKVYSSEDIGVSGMENSDIIITDLTIPLLEGTAVNIPFQTVDMNNIIGFNATIRIDHKDLIIKGENHITLSIDKTTVVFDETITITARYLDSDGLPISDAEITFYDGATGIGTDTTDTNGYATITKSWSSTGTHSITATYGTITSSTITVTVNKYTPTLTLSANTDTAFTGMSVTVTGNMSYNNTGISGASLKLYNGETLLDDSITTDSNGNFSTTITATSSTMSLLATFDGTSTYTNVNSNTVLIDNCSTYMTVKFTGTTITPDSSANNPLINPNHDVIIDYGDGTVEVSHTYGHTYSTNAEHTIKIYNVTEIGSFCFYSTPISYIHIPGNISTINMYAFASCSSLTTVILNEGLISLKGSRIFADSKFSSITIPTSVTEIGDRVFESNYYNLEVTLGWDTSNDIVAYNSTWIYSTSGLQFIIPNGTTSLYLAKNYPSDKITEQTHVASVTLTSSASEVYNPNTFTLYATVLDNHGNAVSGQTVTFTDDFRGNLGSDTTDSNGVAEVQVVPVYSSSGRLVYKVTASCSSVSSSEVTVYCNSWNGISVSADKSILSYADGDKATLYCQLMTGTSENATSGVTITFKQGSTTLGTAQTDSNGKATLSNGYTSAGVGDVTITAEEGTYLTKTFVVYDYQYYTDNMQKIKNTFIADTTTASNRTIYLSSFTFNSDVEIEFKLKNIPQNWLIGFGSNGTSVNQKGVWFKLQNYNQSKVSIMYVDTGGSTRDAGITTDYGTSTVFTIKSENIHKIYWYLDSVVKAYRDTSTSIPLGLRLDVFNNQDYDIEYIKVKPL